ncbi:hypothetical protein FSC37_03245 [Piscinibacter aquaticus]|uniref:Uncharacterized protein n=1 Tax=Piscinibacter aquaticus TaxID=392597 RepID=A0A5C6U0W4_9BURK|nr:hypothetical protein FSC37_03245 [Piscinibacter aquaticus]
MLVDEIAKAQPQVGNRLLRSDRATNGKIGGEFAAPALDIGVAGARQISKSDARQAHALERGPGRGERQEGELAAACLQRRSNRCEHGNVAAAVSGEQDPAHRTPIPSSLKAHSS